MANGIAVHGGECGCGLVTQGDDRIGEDAAPRIQQGRMFDRQVGGHRQKARLSLGDAKQAHGAVQSPDLPPRFSVTRMSPIRMVLSMAFNMS